MYSSNLISNYNLTFVSIIPDSLKCVLCHNILQNPKQSRCGCRFCTVCLTDYVSKNNTQCPGGYTDCSQLIEFNESNCLKDMNAEREIGQLIVKCPSNTCDHTDLLRKLESHLEICDKTSCMKCKDLVSRDEQEDHMSNECEERIVICEHCHEEMSHRALKEHRDVNKLDTLCGSYRWYCPNDCGAGLVLLKDHIANCENGPIECSFVRIGSDCAKVQLTSMKAHMTLDRHHGPIVDNIQQLWDEMRNMSNLVSTGASTTLLSTENSKLKMEISRLKEEVDSLKMTLVEIQSSLQLSQRNEERIDGLDYKVANFKHKYEPIYSDYVWKVENLSKLPAPGQEYYYSKIFFVARNSYKFRLALNPKAKNEKVALYFQLVAGVFNDILDWPFKLDVELAILGLDGEDDVSVNLFFDPSNECQRKAYRQPVGEFGTMFGVSDIIDLDDLTEMGSNFVKKDCMFVRFRPVSFQAADI